MEKNLAITNENLAKAELALSDSKNNRQSTEALGISGLDIESLQGIRAKKAKELGLTEAQLEMLTPYLPELKRMKARLQNLQQRLEVVVSDNRRLLPIAPVANSNIPKLEERLTRKKWLFLGPEIVYYKKLTELNLNFFEWENAPVFRWVCEVISELSTPKVKLLPVVVPRWKPELFSDKAERDYVYRDWSGEAFDYVFAIRIIFPEEEGYWKLH